MSHLRARLAMVGRFAWAVALSAISCSADGWACSRSPDLPSLTREMQYSNAASVIVGHLIKVEEVEPPNHRKADAGLLEGTFRLIEVLKGEAPVDSKVRSHTFQPGNCTVPLVAGSDYVFYLDGSESLVTWTTGSAHLGNVDAPVAQRLLEQLRSLGK